MHRSLVRSLSAGAALLVLADGLAAQAPASTRVLLVPQMGAIVHPSEHADATPMASLAVEVPVGRGWSLMAEGTAATTDYLLRVCHGALASCTAPTGIRGGAAAGVVVRPLQRGRLQPYAGMSAGVARWVEGGERGNGPLASVRAGVDVRVAGPFGVRADLVRRVLWSGLGEAEYASVHADVVSLGASFALRR